MSPPSRVPPASSTNNQPTARSISDLPWMLLVAALALVVFSRSWSFDFTSWDDGAYITTNPNMVDAGGLQRIWFSAENEQYYPLTFTTFWIEHQLWGDRPAGYHIVNTLLHALNAALVFMLLRRLGLTRWVAVVTSTAFALHPMQVMSVAWIAERKNLLSCLFLLLTLLGWLRYRNSRGTAAAAASILCFAAALLSKSAVAIAPVILVALDTLVLGLPLRRSLRAIWPFALLSIASIWITSRFEAGFLDPTVYEVIPTFLHRILFASRALWTYVGRLLFPFDQSPIYAMWIINPASAWAWTAFAAFVAAFLILMRFRNHLLPAAKWGLLSFVALLAPILGLVAYGNLAVSPTSDHYLYIASIGMFMAVAASIDPSTRRTKRSPLITAVVAVALTACGVRSWIYTGVFRDGPTMWAHTLKKDPDCFPAHVAMGRWFLDRGEPASSLEHFQAAARIHPTRCEGIAGLGEAQAQLARWDEARQNLDRALDSRIRLPSAVISRAAVAEHDGQTELALALLQTVPHRPPWDALAGLRRALVLLRSGATKEARDLFAEVVRLRPDDASGYQGLVECDRILHDWHAAIENARRGLAARPDRTSLKNLLALTLATCPDDRLRDGRAALKLAEEVVGSLGRSNFQALETLAAAQAETGDFAAAAACSREAARLARAAGHTRAVSANEAWAAQYEQHRPRRDP